MNKTGSIVSQSEKSLITHEEVMKIINDMENDLHEYLVTFNVYYDFDTIRNYIKQQQQSKEERANKVDELLELKNRKIKYLEARLKYNHGDKINFLMYFDEKLNTEALEEIEIEIKALEEELK